MLMIFTDFTMVLLVLWKKMILIILHCRHAISDIKVLSRKNQYTGTLDLTLIWRVPRDSACA